MAERTSTYSDAKYTGQLLFFKRAAVGTTDTGDQIILRADQKMIIDRAAMVTSTAYSAGDDADEIDLVVNVAGAEALRVNSTKLAMVSLGAVASGAGPVSVAAGALVDVDIDVTDANANLAGGTLDLFLYCRIDPS